MKKLVLIGAGGHGRVVADTAEAAGYRDICFLDDSWPSRGTNGDWAIVDRLAGWRELDPEAVALFVSIGDNATRLRLGQEIGAGGRFDMPPIVHPRAIVSSRARISAGAVVMAGAIIQPFAEIARFAIVNTGATIDHDCRVGEAVHVSPGANIAGTVTVGARSWVGIGASVRQNITIGSDVMVGAGAVVVSDIPDETKVVGTPARPASRS